MKTLTVWKIRFEQTTRAGSGDVCDVDVAAETLEAAIVKGRKYALAQLLRWKIKPRAVSAEILSTGLVG